MHDRYALRVGDGSQAETVTAAAQRVRKALRGWRVVERSENDGRTVTLSAEKGYLREIGNVVFHLSLVGMLIVVAIGKMFGFEGSVIVRADGSGFCSSTPISYDNFRPGLFVDGTDMTPFCVKVDDFTADYTSTGQASSFRADIEYQTKPTPSDTDWSKTVLEVNDPLRLDGQRLYLLGHGFAPKFSVTYPNGQTASYTAPFQPTDSAFTSQGAIKIPSPLGYTGAAVQAHQLAIVGLFAPTSRLDGGILTSAFPSPDQSGGGRPDLSGRTRHEERFGVLHRPGPGDVGRAEAGGHGQPRSEPVDHPRRRHQSHLHRVRAVGLAADFV